MPDTPHTQFAEEMQRRKTPLSSGVSLDLERPEERELRRAVGAVVLRQHHGELIRVPAGWLHAVSNRKPCIKVAFEFLASSKACLYPTVSKMIAEFIGSRAAADYMPMQTAAYNTAMHLIA